jgi:glycosyltransferase involved in cell wall biosynthesis
MVLVSIVIKALNEETHIAAAIESAMKALAGLDGEIILADGVSSDRTVEIASAYPIRIVQLAKASERGCGVGPQLGYQYSKGRYVCLIDGDMELDERFLKRAVDFLAEHRLTAGVGGAVAEKNVVNLEFQRRGKRANPDLEAGEVDRLNGGGLYRRAAIDSVGYFSDRNLHGHEEFELATRLRAAGWSLHRLDAPFVSHHGHTMDGYRLLWRRFRSRYLRGSGETLRAALGKPHLGRVLSEMRELRLWLAVYVWWIAIVAVLWSVPDTPPKIASALLLLVLPCAVMSVRYRSFALGVYSVVAWNAHAIGAVIGFAQRRASPSRWIESHIIADKVSNTDAGARAGDGSP